MNWIKDKMLYEVYDPQFSSEVLSLLDFHWGFSDLRKSKALFEWRYENNPYTDSPSVYLARCKGKVIGLRCFVVQKFHCASDTVLMACPADAIVHPEFRRKGVLNDLTLFSIERLQACGVAIVLSLSSNKASASAARKLGWQELGSTRYLYRFSWAGALTSEVTNLPITVYDRGITIEISEAINPIIPPHTIYPSIGDYQFSNVRDNSYYSWRYRQPFKNFYSIFARDEGLTGYLILEERAKYEFLVMEYGYDSAEIFDSMFKVGSRCLGARMMRMLDVTLTKEQGKAFRKAGFLYEPSILLRALNKHRVVPMAYLLNSDMQHLGVLPRNNGLANKASWHILAADVH